MITFIRLPTDAEYAAIKTAAKSALKDIKYVIKRNSGGTTHHRIYIYCREESGRWSESDADRVYAFVLAQGLLFNGATPRRDTCVYNALTFVR